MSIEPSLDKLRKSSVTWIVGSAVAITSGLMWNATGLYNRIEQQTQLITEIKQTQSEQKDISSKLETNQQALAIANATFSARLDAAERRLTIVEEELHAKR